MALAVLASWYICVATPDDVPRAHRRRAFVAALAGAVAGAFAGRWLGGGGFYLGALGSMAFVRVVARPSRLGRHAAVAMGVVIACWGLGLYLDGGAWGYPLSSEAPAWAQALGVYPRWRDGTGAPALFAQIDAGWLPLDATSSLPAHPIGLYFAAVGVAIAMAGLYWRHQPMAVWLGLGAFAAMRLWLDAYRGDLGSVALATERALSCAVILAAAVVVWQRLASAQSTTA